MIFYNNDIVNLSEGRFSGDDGKTFKDKLSNDLKLGQNSKFLNAFKNRNNQTHQWTDADAQLLDVPQNISDYNALVSEHVNMLGADWTYADILTGLYLIFMYMSTSDCEYVNGVKSAL